MSNYRRYFIKNHPIFITIVTYKREDILISNIELLRKSFEITKKYYNFDIIAICVMKNHIHMILSLDITNELPQIIRTLKQNFTKLIPEKYYPIEISESMKKRNEKGIWQRRYYDHIIRNEKDLCKHIDYIHFNSMKHYNIAPKYWQFSSFDKFVKNNLYDINWCNFEDKNNILEMDAK